MVVRCASSTRGTLLALGLLVVLGACARPAPDLPPDYASVNAPNQLEARDFSTADLAKSCTEIAAERAELEKLNRLAQAEIQGDRTQNQVAGYFAALFILPVVAVDTNEKQVALLDRNQVRIDNLRRLSHFKDCGSAGPSGAS